MSTVELLPEEKLPECWKDEARINVLFAPFRSRSVNPKDWDSKLLFWKNLISVYCIHKKIFTFKVTELAKVFNRNGRSPACLGDVIDELYKGGELKTLDEFLQKPSETWATWAVDIFVKKPMNWSYNKIKSKIVQPNTDVVYVHLYAVESEANKLLMSVPDNFKNKVVTLKKISELKELQNIKIESLQILLHHLMCQGKASLQELQDNEKHHDNVILLKIYDVKKCDPITSRDVDVYILEQSEDTLIKDIEKLENEMAALVSVVKSYLSKGNRQTAKTYLRKKREIEKCILKRTNALNNIQTLLSRIQDVDSDVQVLDSYKAALSRLRGVFNEAGITEEDVSNTMLELDEVLELHSDIQATLSQTSLSNADTDLEAELAELIAGDEKGACESENLEDKVAEDSDLLERMKNLGIKLPSVPQTKVETKSKVSL